MAKKPIIKTEKFVKIHQFEDIFTIVERNEEFVIAIGNKIIVADKFKSLSDAQKYIESKPWKLIINATCCIYDMSKNSK